MLFDYYRNICKNMHIIMCVEFINNVTVLNNYPVAVSKQFAKTNMITVTRLILMYRAEKIYIYILLFALHNTHTKDDV